MLSRLLLFITLALLLLSHSLFLSAASLNGFNLDNSRIAHTEIYQGGPPRDGIPSIDQPRFEAAAIAVRWLGDDALVLGLEIGGEARAYPLAIMNWHEVVNDRIADRAVAITYCPLCGSGMAFDAAVAEDNLQFGVSGLLYNSDVLLYDRQSESLWSQLRSEAISGPLAGTRLTSLPLQQMTLGEWRRLHPDSQVLSRQTGHQRNYSRNPYAGYDSSEGLYFPVAFSSQKYHPKERVLGISLGGKHKAYPYSELSRSGLTEIRDQLGGQQLLVRYNPVTASATAFDPAGQPLPAVTVFWFAWYAFYPDAALYKADESPARQD
ncbi:DUF3179 domain-containing protein [Marinobacterium jannaschii]|uniref:DUF3179 domain-containing protein n=1 Tax=Marinobacterium jannaschii TaxID=64970 RepID=UPI000568B745|nr:DUF3179 domain-containing protein [Marinobacterium jannaschii]